MLLIANELYTSRTFRAKSISSSVFLANVLLQKLGMQETNESENSPINQTFASINQRIFVKIRLIINKRNLLQQAL